MNSKLKQTVYDNKNKVRKYIELTFGLLLAAVAFNLFFFPLKIVIGGNGGVAILGEHLFLIRPSIVILIYVFITMILGLIFLGVRPVKHSIYGSLIFPLLIDLTANIGKFVIIDHDNPLVVFIIGAVITGVAFGLIYKTGFTSGGGDILKLILSKYFGLTMGKAGFVINGLIVLLGAAFFGWNKAMYAIVVLYIAGIITDRILLGISKYKAFYIVTSKEDEVKEYILKDLGKGVSIFKSKKERTNEEQEVLMCVIPTNEYFKLKEGIKAIDGRAFFVIVDAYEVKGEFNASTSNFY